MSAVLTTEDLKLLIGVLCQIASDKKTFPTPDHARLAETTGFDSRVACKNRWSVLTRKIKNGDYGDMGDIFVERDSKEAGDKNRPVVEVLVAADDPPKKAKAVKKTCKGKTKEKVVKAEDDEQDWDDDEI